MSYLPLDGPSDQGTVSITDAAITEVKVGGSTFPARKVITVQSEDGKFRLYFGVEGVVPSPATVIADGFLIHKGGLKSFEASDQQPVYIISVNGNIDVTIAERA